MARMAKADKKGGMPRGISRQGGQNREPTKRTGAGAQFKQRSQQETGRVQQGRPAVGRRLPTRKGSR